MQYPLYKDWYDEVLLGLNAQIQHILTDDITGFLSLMICKESVMISISPWLSGSSQLNLFHN